MSEQILLRHLPEIYQDLSEDSRDLRVLLAAFDKVLFGTEGQDHKEQGLEEIIANIPNLFNPTGQPDKLGVFHNKAPGEFLPWLGEWVALEHLHIMPEEQYRKLIAKIVPLYAIRGTKEYLKKMLVLFFPRVGVNINDGALPSMQVGVSRIGEDTRLGGDIPFYFTVKLQLLGNIAHSNSQNDRDRLRERICSVIDLAKPAYTCYELDCDFEDLNDVEKNTDTLAGST